MVPQKGSKLGWKWSQKVCISSDRTKYFKQCRVLKMSGDLWGKAVDFVGGSCVHGWVLEEGALLRASVQGRGAVRGSDVRREGGAAWS